MDDSEGIVRWTWDSDKNETNRREHGIGFETAALVLNDPFVVTQRDPYRDEQRWRTMGLIGNTLVIVVHTSPLGDADSGVEVWRMISARQATRNERQRYEEGEC